MNLIHFNFRIFELESNYYQILALIKKQLSQNFTLLKKLIKIN